MQSPQHLLGPHLQILPRLFLGSVHALDDGMHLIRSLGVTSCLSVAPRISEKDQEVLKKV